MPREETTSVGEPSRHPLLHFLVRDALALVQLFQSGIDLEAEVQLSHDVIDRTVVGELTDHLDDLLFHAWHVASCYVHCTVSCSLDRDTHSGAGTCPSPREDRTAIRPLRRSTRDIVGTRDRPEPVQGDIHTLRIEGQHRASKKAAVTQASDILAARCRSAARRSGCTALVAMMKPTDLRDGDDLSGFNRLHLAPIRRVLVEGQVRAVSVVVSDVVVHEAP